MSLSFSYSNSIVSPFSDVVQLNWLFILISCNLVLISFIISNDLAGLMDESRELWYLWSASMVPSAAERSWYWSSWVSCFICRSFAVCCWFSLRSWSIWASSSRIFLLLISAGVSILLLWSMMPMIPLPPSGFGSAGAWIESDSGSWLC